MLTFQYSSSKRHQDGTFDVHKNVGKPLAAYELNQLSLCALHRTGWDGVCLAQCRSSCCLANNHELFLVIFSCELLKNID